MKPVSVSFCCLLGLLALGQVLGQTDDASTEKLTKCVEDGFTAGECTDLSGIIHCLENVVVGEKEVINKQVQGTLLYSFNKDRSVCPAANQAGSCLDKDIKDCKDRHGYDDLNYNNCSSMEDTSLCLEAVKQSCNTSTATAKIENKQWGMVCDGCRFADVQNCLDPIYPKRWYQHDGPKNNCTAEAIDQATQCLDAKDSACTYLFDANYAQSFKDHLNGYLCPSPAV